MITRRLSCCFLKTKREKMASCLLAVFTLYLIVIFINSEVPPQCAKDDCSESDSANSQRIVENKYSEGKLDEMHLSVVACGDRLEETLVMLKSAALFAHNHLTVHIFADEELKPLFRKQLEKWPEFALNKLTYNLYSIQYPTGDGISPETWRKLFKPCATQRLFIPNILTDVEKILYVDTDILFLRPVDDVWLHFSRFNDTHIAALSPEHENPSAGWYNRFARHPYYGPLGVNSGVMLMNLKLMRALDWVNVMIAYYKEYKLKITWGDQDLINIFFHFRPEMLYIYDCSWNYRPDHCMYMSNCKPAEEKGVSVLHGCRSYFHLDKQPAFKVIYQSFLNASFDVNDVQSSLLSPIDAGFKENNVANSNCGRVHGLLTKKLRKFASQNGSDKL